MDGIEQEISSGFRLLRFSPEIERKFEQQTAEDRCKHMIKNNYIGLMIYHCFLFSDRWSVGDVFYLDIFVHFAIMTPVALATNYCLSRNPPAWLREGLETAALVVLSVTIVWVVAASRMPDRDLVNFTLSLVILFAIIMHRIRFWHVVVACGLIQILYSAALVAIETPPERMVMSNSLFLGIVLFSLVGAYTLERETRVNFLLRLRDAVRNQQLEIASLRDALTGVSNRRALDAALLNLSPRALSGHRRPSAILLLDIDHFKRFNDANGHQGGDRCLRRVAALIEGSLRERDATAYRFGGEEFLVLLEQATRREAMGVAERIRTAVADAAIPSAAGSESVVTVSIGVACGILGETTADALVADADAALYSAKHEGRNRVAFFTDRNGPALPSLEISPLVA